MSPKTPIAQSFELFRQPLCEMLSAKHPLVKSADVIDWDEIERSFGARFQATTGRLARSHGLYRLRFVHLVVSDAAGRVE